MNRKEYLLVVLMEECAEVAHRASKMLRFGRAEVEPGQHLTNHQRLQAEVYDLFATVEMLNLFYLNAPAVDAIEAKKAKVTRYMDYSIELGTVDSET